MNIEFKKTLSNYIILIVGILFSFLFLLGYFLPVGIDKVKHLTYEEYFFSAYTVATEFGFLLFSFVIAYFINKEYANKNILFYKLIGENIFSFFYKKIAVLFIESLFFIFIAITVISIIFSNFSQYHILLILFSLVILQYILIVGTISVVSPNVLISIGISIVYWIGTIILVAVDKSKFGILAPFEASNTLYGSVEKLLKGDILFLSTKDIVSICIYFLIIFILNCLILILCRKRWLKLGL
ncbi:peptide ABC transporter permease [Staphylococcus kloosii]|uniref:peptide ABC transporter permease n=1 Tax=Staphylococcus kloosii TaxID=29384 RepID=UPI0028A47DC2|nr:peptide ABC transporter permease [Staphylococcus kloosii]MDT3958873.1 peptide ABC transporter permease [Staphylococcus kloosii]